MKAFRFVTLLLALAITLSACGSALRQNPAEDITIRVPFTIWPGNYPIAIAQQQGFFANHGVEVEIKYYEAYPETYKDYITGNQDGLSVSMGDILPNLDKRASKIVMITDSSEGADQLLVADDIQSISDLKGKRIGVNFNTYGDYWVRQLLKDNQMKVSDVELVNIAVENMPAEFLKSVDVAHSYEPYTSEALKNGGHILLTSADTSRWQIPSPFVFSEEMVKNHPQAVRGFVAAFFEAVDWMYAHSDDEVLAEVAKQFPDVPADYFWLGGDYVTTLADNKKLMQPGDDFNSIHFTAKEYTRFLADNGILNFAPNLDDLIDSSFLP
jgi:NitT/TauT family transport system substrate-binding protein